jgi:hypothetical protein
MDAVGWRGCGRDALQCLKIACRLPIYIVTVLGFLIESEVALSEERNHSGMSAALVGQSEELSGDLVPFISEADTSLVLVKIANVQLDPRREMDRDLEEGTIRCQVVEVFRSTSLNKGDIINLPARRIADPLIRARNNFDQWNNLPLEQGQHLLLACRLALAPSLWKALAARAVESPRSPAVAALRQCALIEQFRGGDERKREMIEEALQSPEDLERYYALDALGRRALFSREVAVEMIRRAIVSTATAPESKLELGASLTGNIFFNKGKRAEGSNPAVVAGLARGLVNEPDLRRRLNWARYLASCILVEFSPRTEADKEIRLSLIKSVQDPSPAKVLAALTELSGVGASDEQEIVRELIEAWRDDGGNN